MGPGAAAAGPTVRAALLADHIYRDQLTGKHVVAGTFQQINAPEFPTILPRSVGVFLVLTGLSGRHALELQFVDDGGAVLAAMDPFQVAGDDPGESLEIGLEVPPLPLPHAGSYALRVFADDQPVADVPVRVTLIEAAA